MDEKEIIDQGTKIVTEVLKDRSKDVYDDALKPAAKQSGEALSTIVGLINHVVLFPIKKVNLTFKFKIEQFETDLKNKLQNIPEEKIIEPKLSIVGPAIESLKYTFQEEELRQMYLSLIASAMNEEVAGEVHPSFVSIIKEMSPVDAMIFKETVKTGNIPCARIRVKYNDKFFNETFPRYYLPDFVEIIDPYVASSSVENLCRLGLLDHRTGAIESYDYKAIEQNAFVQKLFHDFKSTLRNSTVGIDIKGERFIVTDFGKMFKKTCLD